jgi:hypothetical protein
MKIKTAIYLVGLVFLAPIATNAATQTTSDSQSLSDTGVTFTFNQFNPVLGTLTAVDMIISSSIPSGSVVLTKSGGGSATYSSLSAGLQLYDNDEIYFDNGTSRSLIATPNSGNGTFTSSSPLGDRTFTLTGGQSLLATTPTSFSLLNTQWGNFIGTGQMQITGFLNALASASGSNVGYIYSALSAPTSVTVQYSYNSAAIPEPGQVAASLLLLSGIGAYVFIKRRKKSAPAVA